VRLKTRLVPLAPVAVIPLLATWIVQERRRPRPMSPFWSFTLEGRARVDRAPETLAGIGLRAGLRVLEIGCGPGVMLEAAAQLVGPEGEIHAIDVQPEMLTRARARLARHGIGGVTLTEADAGAIPYADGAFDLVYMVTVIGELPDHEGALAEIRRVLAPGGVFAVTEEIFDPHYTTPRRVQALCARAGLRHVGTTGGRLEQTSRFAVAAGKGLR
jgi:ubiquinone/menaquinone biosynthesis C-methylase UbiE